MKILDLATTEKVQQDVRLLECRLRELTGSKDLFVTVTGVHYLTLTVDIIIDTAYKLSGAPDMAAFLKIRKREYIAYKMCAMYFLKHNLNMNLNEIGEKLGGLDHTTIIHGLRQFKNHLSKNDKLACEVYTNTIKNIQQDKYEMFKGAC